MLEGLLMKNEESILLCEQPTIFNNSRFCHKFIIRAHQILLLAYVPYMY